MQGADIARSRAPTALSARIETIRAENAVMDKNKDSLGLLLYKIVDCERMSFYPFTIDDPRGRIFVRAISATLQQHAGDLGRHVE